jgi:hypothetical protein
VKLTNGNGQGTCVENTNVDGKKENTSIVRSHHTNTPLLTLSNTPGIAAKICIKAKMIFT